MNKTAIKNYAIWARVQLIESCKQRAFEYGITEDGENQPDLNTINGRILSDAEINQRKRLISQIDKEGYSHVMEEAAYTWFNRFIALRFMEVNGYLPSKVRVFSDENGDFKPEILKQAMSVDIAGIDQSAVLDLLDKQDNEELYKYLLIIQCNALNECLPYIFEKISNWTELLFPTNLLRNDGIIGRLVSEIPEEDWTDQVQIIGWLYQYYNTEPKDAVFVALKKNVKITKENIPAATQLFTPDWIVRYMVENSLGRLWLEGHPNDTLKSNWKYYLDEAEQEPDVQKQLDEIRKEHAALKPEDIKCIDPCMGSGHILCYMFDVLIQIYEDYGYTAREAVESIVEKNLWGLDIDKRAAQLAYFAVMMKARQYDRRFLTKDIQPRVYAIEESNGITTASLHGMGTDLSKDEYDEARKQTMQLIEELNDAKEYGSITEVTPCDWSLLRRFAVPRFSSEEQLEMNIHDDIKVVDKLQTLIYIGQTLSQKYDVVVTNPPYMGSSGMNAKLSDYVKKRYSDSKSDLFAVFIEHGNKMIKANGYNSMVTMQSWMFLSGFEKMRMQLLQSKQIVTLMHMENMVMHIAFGTAATVFRNIKINGYKGTYNQIKQKDIINNVDERPCEFPVNGNRFSHICDDNFAKIPGSPIAYWVGEAFISAFGKKALADYLEGSVGIKTGNNELFLRKWWEIRFGLILFDAKTPEDTYSEKKCWIPYNKGGEYRKWIGNDEYVVNWTNDGNEIKQYCQIANHHCQDYQSRLKFKPLVTWSSVTSGAPAFRIKKHQLSDMAGISLFGEDNYLLSTLGFCNSIVARQFLQFLAPTINIKLGPVLSTPFLLNDEQIIETGNIAKILCELSKADWDAFETSWDFQSHPLVPMAYERKEQLEAGVHSEERKKSVSLLSERYRRWEQECDYRFSELKKNEEELNRIFIDIYGLQDELTPEVDDKDVTVRKADLQRDIRSLISYAVGCMMGRYSLDVPGLAYAGGEFDESKYVTFKPDTDAIIPICDDYYFDDDIVGRFIEFVKVVYGEETLEENLQFIADALGGKGTAREIIRKYFIKDFYKDHLKVYQKRPIYWLFSSGKKNGFKALIYMHRYQPDMLARMRTDYVHEQQERYRTQLQLLEEQAEKAAPSERVKINKQINKLKDQSLEIQQYEEKIHHLADQMIEIDLDDGVKVNYAKFQDVLEKLK